MENGDLFETVGLLPAMLFEDAVDDGYISFGGTATETTLSIDVDGAAGPATAAVACTFSGLAFVDTATSEALFANNVSIG